MAHVFIRLPLVLGFLVSRRRHLLGPSLPVPLLVLEALDGHEHDLLLLLLLVLALALAASLLLFGRLGRRAVPLVLEGGLNKLEKGKTAINKVNGSRKGLLWRQTQNRRGALPLKTLQASAQTC